MTAARRSINPAFLLLLMPLLGMCMLPGCSGSGDAGAGVHRFTETTRDGVVVATSSGAPKYEGPLFTFEEVTRLKEDERPESLLNRVGDVLADEDGAFYVVDYGDRRIAVFDSRGRYDHAIGRQGDGPGEFRSVQLLRVRGGIVSVYDAGSSRFDRFTDEGRFLDASPLPRAMRMGTVRFERLPDGRFLHIRSGDGRPQMMHKVGEPVIDTYAVTFLSTAGDTLGSLEPEPLITGRYINLNEGGDFPSIFPMKQMMGPAQDVAFDPDHGILVSEGRGPELTIYGLDGAPRRRIRVEVPVEPVTPEDREEVLGRGRRILDEIPDERSRQMVQAQIDNTHFAEVKAPWQGVNLDDYGYIWLVMPYTTVEAEGESGPRQRVLSPQGEYLGECALPRDMVGFSRGFVTVRRTDPETHQEQYIVYRMVPAAEGFKYP